MAQRCNIVGKCQGLDGIPGGTKHTAVWNKVMASRCSFFGILGFIASELPVGKKEKENSTQIKQRVFYFLNKMLFTPHQEVNLTARLTAHLNLCSSSVVRNRKCLMLCERLIIRSPHKHSALISCSDYVPALGPARLWDIFSGTQRSRFFTLADCWRVQEKKQKKKPPEIMLEGELRPNG